MPRFVIIYHCNGHTAQNSDGVELDSVEQAGAYALATNPQVFDGLILGERRECAFEVQDESHGWRMKIDLTLWLEERDPAPDALDTGLLAGLAEPA
jgi:hypothetical protein